MSLGTNGQLIGNCDCHYETKPHGGADLMNLSYNLWLISGGIDYLPEDEREGHYMGLIERAQSTVDLQGMSPAEAYVKLKPTLARSYWSRWETLAELGLKEDW